MKKKVISTQKLLFWTMLIMILPMLGACQKDDGLDQEGVINLKDIPENPIFADLPLVGTKWKLVGFANSETGKIKVADVGLRGEDRLPECARCFTLFFDEMGVFEFFSTLNKFMRNYRVENIDSQLFFEGGYRTTAGERGDGEKFAAAMYKVDKFNISSRGLALYYGSSDYLLFQPSME